MSEREAEIKYQVSDTTIHRTIERITEWMDLMETQHTTGDDENAVIVLRRYRPDEDAGALYASWRNALWFGQKEGSRDKARAAEFFSQATKVIKHLLADPKVDVRIACLQDEPIVIAGYSISIGSHLVFACVKSDYRRKGIARLLCKGITSVAPPST
jgi:ribosomal protein S18 acetylase RimI-like enzyme